MDLRQRLHARDVVHNGGLGLGSVFEAGVYKQREVVRRGEYGLGLGVLPALALVVVGISYSCAGLVSVLFPAASGSSALGVTGVRCLRATRHADYVTVHASMGSPARTYNLLLRMDKTILDSTATLRLFSPKAIESHTLNCDTSSGSSGSTVCTDTLLVTTSPSSQASQRRVVANFGYTNYLYEADYPEDTLGIAISRLRLDGELRMKSGLTYELTENHLCWSSNAREIENTTQFAAEIDGATGLLHTTVDALADAPKTSFARKFCNDSSASVTVFPHIAADDLNYLRIFDPLLLENQPNAVLLRRRVVEAGTDCASALGTSYEHAVAIYELDCVGACFFAPSLPFRTAASKTIVAKYGTSEAAFVFTESPSLGFLSDVLSYGDAVALSALKFALTLLAAALVFTRRTRSFARPYFLYNRCLAHARGHVEKEGEAGTDSAAEDAVLGGLAACARFAVTLWRLESLGGGALARASWFNLAAASVSAVHFLVRNFVLAPSLFDAQRSGAQSPTERIGGSSGLADVIGAILIILTPASVLTTGNSFDAVARLLVAMVAQASLVPRLFFSTACVALDATTTPQHEAYFALVVFALLHWIFQTITLAVTLADLVCTPLCYKLTAGATGETISTAIAAFLAVSNLAIPRVLGAAIRIKRVA